MELQLFQDKNGYRYNSDSLFFYHFLRSQLPPTFAKTALDVGCGCGILALLFKRDFQAAQVCGVDILAQNAAMSAKNAAQNSLEIELFCGDFTRVFGENQARKTRQNPAQIPPNSTQIPPNPAQNLAQDSAQISAQTPQITAQNAAQIPQNPAQTPAQTTAQTPLSPMSNSNLPAGDLAKAQAFSPATALAQRKFDVIFSNPPFYAGLGTPSANAHIDTARNAAHLPLREFFAVARRLLAAGGRLVFCYDARQLGAVAAALSASGFGLAKAQFLHARAGRGAKIAFFEARLDRRVLCEVLPPIFTYETSSAGEAGENKKTALTREIYAHCATKSVEI